MNINRELIKQLQALPKEDLQNLLALNGAGTFKRQATACFKYWLARNWPKLIPYGIYLAIAIGLVLIVELAVVIRLTGS